MPDVFPSILPDRDDEPFVDDSYTAAELDAMGWDEIRRVAAEYDTDEITGRSDRDEMEEWLEGRERI